MILGSNRLNFYSDSSIFEDSCDTIIMDYHLCMKNVFSLPVRLIVQRCEYWEPVSKKSDGAHLTEYGKEVLHTELLRRLGEDGKMVTETYAAQTGTDAVTVTVMAECLENIGVEIPISETELRRIQAENIPREEAVND